MAVEQKAGPVVQLAPHERGLVWGTQVPRGGRSTAGRARGTTGGRRGATSGGRGASR